MPAALCWWPQCHLSASLFRQCATISVAHHQWPVLHAVQRLSDSGGLSSLRILCVVDLIVKRTLSLESGFCTRDIEFGVDVRDELTSGADAEC